VQIELHIRAISADFLFPSFWLSLSQLQVKSLQKSKNFSAEKRRRHRVSPKKFFGDTRWSRRSSADKLFPARCGSPALDCNSETLAPTTALNFRAVVTNLYEESTV
jgi:hypothetical protein